MNKKEGIMNGEFTSNYSNINHNNLSEEDSYMTIELTEEHEPTVNNSPENYIQEINFEEVYIDEVIVEKISLRKYTKKQRAKNPEDFFINSLGGFKYILKKISDPRNNTSSYDKMENFDNLDTMLLKNKLNPSTSADESTSLEYFEDEPPYEIGCVDESDTSNEVDNNTVVILSKRILEEESSYGETSRNIKRQRNSNRSEEESNSISSFNETDTDDVSISSFNTDDVSISSFNETDTDGVSISSFNTDDVSISSFNTDDVSISSFNETDTDDVPYSIVNVKVLNHEEEYNMDRFVDYNYTSETEKPASDKYNVLMQDDNFINDSQDTDETDKNVMNNGKGIDKNLPIFSVDDDDDDDDAESRKPIELSTDMPGFNLINYIHSDRKDIIFPGYNEEVYLELFDYVVDRQKTDKLHPVRCCSCTIEDLVNVFSPRLWLNDIIIEHYFRLLVKNYENELIVSLDSLFLTIYDIHGFEKATNSIKGPIKNVLDCDKVIVPTHLGNHWAFTIVKIKKRKIIYYDSIKSTNYESEMTLLTNYLNDAYSRHRKPEDEEKVHWSLRIGNCPLQTNDYDCGVFTCTNARHALFGKKKQNKYTQEDTPLLRYRITYEILNDFLLPTVNIPVTADTPDSADTADIADTPDTADTP